MANVYSDEDLWGAPAQGGKTALSDDEVWGAPSPKTVDAMNFAEPLDIRSMSKDQLLQAYRTLPVDDPMRNMVRDAIVSGYTRGPEMTGTQSAIAGATDALSLGLSDEINAGLSALGGGSYEGELGAQRQMMKNAEADNPGAYLAGQIGGGVVQGVATGGGSLWGTGGRIATRAIPAATFRGRAVQTAANIAKPAIEGAAVGGVYGFNSGEGGFGNRLASAGEGAAWGAGGGAVVATGSKVLGKSVNALRGQTNIHSSDDIADMSQKLYREATQAGATIKPNTMANLGRRMIGVVEGDINYSKDVPEGFTKARLAMDMVNRVFVKRGPNMRDGTFNLNETARGIVPAPGTAPRAPRGAMFHGTATEITGGKPVTLEELEVVRRRLTKLAGQTNDDDEARMIFQMRNELDGLVDSLDPADLASGDKSAFAKLEEARKLWRVSSETEWAEEMLKRAESRAGQFSVSKMENALRTETRQAAMNQKKMRRMPEEVVKATEKVANPGVVQNTIRNMGRFAPLAGKEGAVVTAIAPHIGIPLMAGGQVAQWTAGALTKKNFRKLQRTIQRSLAPKPVPVPKSETIVRRAAPYMAPGLLGGPNDEVY